MSRNRRRWEEPTLSNREPGDSGRAHHDDHSWRHYTPSTDGLPRRTFNYWREETLEPTSYYPRRSYGLEGTDDQWRDDNRPRQSSYPRRRRDFGPGRDGDHPELRRDRSPSYRNSPHHRYSTYAPAPGPYIPRPAFRARSPIESQAPIPKHALPSPAPKKSSEPLKPTPGYLALSVEPSEILQDSGRTRKLLVLDLNGTLLIRSARSRAPSGPQLRPVQPRPYMQSFRQYLFCTDTKTWLDTMVWSSAQPHSVDDMVEKVFGATKDELKAVWSRKSLGLSEAEYHRKTVTMKDLTKPWNLLASASGHGKIKGHSAVPSQSQSIHSAFTTLLLDDSPHKALLQPYNHVCIPEYDSTRRQRDLRTFLATKKPKEGKQSKSERRKNQVDTATHSVDHTVPGSSKRGGLTDLTEGETYEATLLAVIGILEAVKLQSNVAGWIRKGGLWATQERQEEVGALGVKLHGIVHTEDGKTVASAVVGTGNDASSTSDPAVTPEQAHLHKKMWFDDSSVVNYWIARGRRALMKLGIPATHGVTG